MKTLEQLAAVIDFGAKTAQFNAVSEELVPLQQCECTGHLLLDLSSDWINSSYDAAYMERLRQPGFQSFHAPDSFAVHESEDDHTFHADAQHVGTSHVPSQELCATAESPHLFECDPPASDSGLKDGEFRDPEPVCEHGGAFDSVDGGIYSGMQPASLGDGGYQEGQEQESQEQGEDDRRRNLRLLPEGGARSQRPTTEGRDLQRQPHTSPLSTWLPFRQERLGNVVDMQGLRAEAGIHPGVRGPWTLPFGRSFEPRHHHPAAGKGQRDQGEPGSPLHGECGIGWSRTVHATPFGDAEE